MPYKAYRKRGTAILKLNSTEIQERWDRLFLRLKERIAHPTDEHLASRIWKASDLRREISQVRAENIDTLKSTFPNAKEVLRRMEQMGWLLPLPIVFPSGSEGNQAAYLLDMEATREESPDVLELLQGYESRGVLCYAAVLAFHELTTQVPPIAHIAILQEFAQPAAVVSVSSREPKASESKGQPENKTVRDPLGSALFSYRGISCYLTRRDSALAPGIQTRIEGPRVRLRMTTLEQALLDAIFHPVRCGGEAMVLESWENGMERWNSDRIANYLGEINREDYYRRVGAMCSMMDYEPEGQLRDGLQAAKSRYQSTAHNEEPISLLRGLAYSHLIEEWGVTTS